MDKNNVQGLWIMSEGYMLNPEVVIPTDKIEDESEKNPS
jgi:hypothetical protein